jgi:hypothetical protein
MSAAPPREAKAIAMAASALLIVWPYKDALRIVTASNDTLFASPSSHDSSSVLTSLGENDSMLG